MNNIFKKDNLKVGDRIVIKFNIGDAKFHDIGDKKAEIKKIIDKGGYNMYLCELLSNSKARVCVTDQDIFVGTVVKEDDYNGKNKE